MFDHSLFSQHIIKSISHLYTDEVIVKFLDNPSSSSNPLGYAKIYESGTNFLKYSDLKNLTQQTSYTGFKFYEDYNQGTFTSFSSGDPESGQVKLYCLLEDSLIKTPSGDVKIQLLKNGDFVLNENNKPKKIITLPPLFIYSFSELICGFSFGIKKYITAAGIT